MTHRENKGAETAEVLGLDAMDLTSYYESVEWDLLEIWAKKTIYYYPCCQEPYPDVTFFFIVSICDADMNVFNGRITTAGYVSGHS